MLLSSPPISARQDGSVVAPFAHMATTTLNVDGMTCGACTAAIESAFQSVPGVGEVSVSLIMSRAVVHHDPAVISPTKVAETVEDCGFDATVVSTDMPTAPNARDGEDDGPPMCISTFAIEGMTCAACTSGVESGVRELPGVESVNVSLLSERAVVDYDGSRVTAEQIADAIEDRGFGATVLDTTAPPRSGGRRSQVAEASARLSVTTVAISGMTCAACTSAVEQQFRDVDGLVQFNISLLAERAIVTHDATRLSPQQIVDRIEDAGFEATVVAQDTQAAGARGLAHVTFNLHGLRDAVAAAALEEALLQRRGICLAAVDLTTARIAVSYDPRAIGVRSLVLAIEELGYNALLTDTHDTNAQLDSLAKTREVHEWKRAFRFALAFAIPVFLLNMVLPMYLPALDVGRFRLCPGLYLGDLAACLLTIPVQFGVGRRFYVSSFRSLRHRAPTMDVLVMLGTSAAFFYSVFTMVFALLTAARKRPSTVFDTSTMLLTFVTLGRWLENRAKGQTSAALSRLMSLAPSMTTVYDDPIAAEKQAEAWHAASAPAPAPAPASGEAAGPGRRVIPTELLEVGDVVILHPGDKVSADGVVLRGEGYVDESMITGEPRPIRKTAGSAVIAGTVNGTTALDFRVTRAGRDTQLSQIVQLVQTAQTSRAPIQRMADVVAGYFVPAIVTLGLVTFFGWMFISHLLPNPPMVFVAEDNGGRVMVCLKLCISVIVFACPCALGLSTPTAVMVGTGVGAQQGILVKGGAILEGATKITHVVFDKTGTLTTGRMTVADAHLAPSWQATEDRRRLWWQMVGLAEMNSEHPIGRAVLAAAQVESGHPGEGALPGSLGDFDACVGQGIAALVEPATAAEERVRARVLIGNADFLRSRDAPIPDDEVAATESPELAAAAAAPGAKEPAGVTTIHVAIDGQYAGTLRLRDTVKPTARGAVAALHRMGLTTALVTGDARPTALAIAAAVGIPPEAVHASVAPADKQAIIATLEDRGHRVAMVGDGINDSPALATASIGIALASGTDVAVEAADIVLMRPDDLLSVPASLCLSRTVFNRIRLNLVWACLYNLIGLPFAMGLFLPFGGIMLPPMAAGAAMAASSISVVVSSLLLKFWRRPRWMDADTLAYEGPAGPDPRAAVTTTTKTRWDVMTLAPRHGPARLVHQAVGRMRALFLGKPAGGLDTDEGYVPLQTVEPV